MCTYPVGTCIVVRHMTLLSPQASINAVSSKLLMNLRASFRSTKTSSAATLTLRGSAKQRVLTFSP
eukprot:1287900-Amphidinium_carterae.1